MRVLEAIDGPLIEQLRAEGEFFWLDLRAPTSEQLDETATTFGLHPVALEDLQKFGQRPKVDDYQDFVHVVFFGIEHEQPVEVHLVVHGAAMISVHHEPAASLATARQRATEVPPDREEYAVYSVLDALTDSYFPFLELMDERIDALEDVVLLGGDEHCLQTIADLKRTLGETRRRVSAQRDVVATTSQILNGLPGFTGDGSQDYFRDVEDHLLRIGDRTEAYREVLTGLLDVYLSAQSNRLNEFVTKLTILGTVFLPLTFITGFFGQNFEWLVSHVDTAEAFFGLGIGLEIVAVVVLYLWFRRREPTDANGT